MSDERTAEATVASRQAPSETVLLELLRQRQTDAGSLVVHCIRGFTMFLAITGALLKFALDQSATPPAKDSSVIHGNCCLCGWVFGLHLCYERKTLHAGRSGAPAEGLECDDGG